jgi:hypothetical protein
MRKINLFILFVVLIAFTSCSQSTTAGNKVAKPRYHRSWYKDHIYKKKWRVGRIKFEPQKQGVKRVKIKG